MRRARSHRGGCGYGSGGVHVGNPGEGLYGGEDLRGQVRANWRDDWGAGVCTITIYIHTYQVNENISREADIPIYLF